MPYYPEGGDGTPQPFPFTLGDVFAKMSELKEAKVTYSRTMLRAVAEQLQRAVSYTCAGFMNDEPACVWICAGLGEIQVSEDGQAWWLQWDQTHAVSDERELTPPDTDDADELARWMKDQAEAEHARQGEQQAESRYGGDGVIADNE